MPRANTSELSGIMRCGIQINLWLGETMRRRFFAFFSILGTLPILLRLVSSGVISVKFAGIVMGLLLLSLAAGDSVVKVVFPVFAAAIIAAEYTQGDPSKFGGALSALFALALALYGMYLMLSGFFGSGNPKRKR